MTRTIVRLSLLAMAAAVALPLPAQTTHAAAEAHHASAATTHRAAAPGCVTLPAVSPKIPALPAAAPCAKTLYRLTRLPQMKLDYASPLLGEGVREELNEKPETFSLDYVDTKAGTGDPVVPHKCLSVEYTGYLMDGTKFDSSHDRPGKQPIEFLYGAHQVIPGWDTGFEGMRMGGERRLFIPWQLAYGENGRGPIPPKAELIFDVEAVSQSAPREGGPPGSQCARAPMPPRPEMPSPGTAPRGSTPPMPGAAPKSAMPGEKPAPPTGMSGTSTPSTTPPPQGSQPAKPQ